jgi:dolichol-phosphate mannosyltransferase
MGNLLIVTITNLLYGQRFTDYEGCYKAFTRDALAKVTVTAKGFEFDNELICKMLRKGFKIVEVPIQYRPRTYEHGKKITWKHGVKILWTILRWRLLPV